MEHRTYKRFHHGPILIRMSGRVALVLSFFSACLSLFTAKTVSEYNRIIFAQQALINDVFYELGYKGGVQTHGIRRPGKRTGPVVNPQTRGMGRNNIASRVGS